MAATSQNPGFHLHVDRRGSTAILRAAGELDILGAERLEACIGDLAGNSPDTVVIDLREVSFIDSTGLRSLIRAQARGTEADWSLKLVRGPDPVQRVIELTRVDAVFDFVEPSEVD
jgi:anti-anti-sigma factor